MTRGRTLHICGNTLAVLALALALATGAAAQDAPAALTVEVFANSAMAITPQPAAGLPYKLDIYRIDGMRQVEETINQQLPKTEREAQEWLARNQSRIEREYRPAIISAANGITLMTTYQLNRIPAIVINRKTVVYGVTNVNQAIEIARDKGALGGGS